MTGNTWKLVAGRITDPKVPMFRGPDGSEAILNRNGITVSKPGGNLLVGSILQPEDVTAINDEAVAYLRRNGSKVRPK